jgi:hypothetical protein
MDLLIKAWLTFSGFVSVGDLEAEIFNTALNLI